MEENKVQNNVFKLKQFSIQHGSAALKVTTEALILGAFATNIAKNANHILDIGTGTGLLALMIAQKSGAKIDAVEISENAFLLANENVNNSKFSSQIKVFHKRIQDFENEIKYDLIVSNPPFYTNYLKGDNANKNIALHNDKLPFTDLANSIKQLLALDGKFVVLLPPKEMNLLEIEFSLQNLIKTNEIQIHHRQNGKVLRIIATFEYKLNEFQSEHFFIKDIDEKYTEQFIDLLKDYYLIF
jgi:tRNA1Val (adenine37-N6)-methyltransferase